MEFDKEILKEWNYALLLDSCNLCNDNVKHFKDAHPDVYFYFHSFYRIRCNLRHDLEIMQRVGDIQWFTLTFDNKHDKSLITSKRKQATRFLNDLFLVYLMVEEFGEDNGRYHIHGFGVFRFNKGFKDFIKWHSRTKIESLNDIKVRKKIKYLTKYTVKSLPRIRRSKSLVWFSNSMKRLKGLKNGFKECYNCRSNILICKLSFNAYNKVKQALE